MLVVDLSFGVEGALTRVIEDRRCFERVVKSAIVGVVVVVSRCLVDLPASRLFDVFNWRCFERESRILVEGAGCLIDLHVIHKAVMKLRRESM